MIKMRLISTVSDQVLEGCVQKLWHYFGSAGEVMGYDWWSYSILEHHDAGSTVVCMRVRACVCVCVYIISRDSKV
jgi:hypothetical protein